MSNSYQMHYWDLWNPIWYRLYDIAYITNHFGRSYQIIGLIYHFKWSIFVKPLFADFPVSFGEWFLTTNSVFDMQHIICWTEYKLFDRFHPLWSAPRITLKYGQIWAIPKVSDILYLSQQILNFPKLYGLEPADI